MAANLRTSLNNGLNTGLRQSVTGGPGAVVLWILNGGPAVLPAEQGFSKGVFSGTAPFILNGSTAALSTLVLNSNDLVP